MFTDKDSFKCPFCDKTHIHGNCSSMRISHCFYFKEYLECFSLFNSSEYFLMNVSKSQYTQYWLKMIEYIDGFIGWHCFGPERKAYWIRGVHKDGRLYIHLEEYTKNN